LCPRFADSAPGVDFPERRALQGHLAHPLSRDRDLLYQPNLISSASFRPLETPTAAAFIYFAIGFAATLASARREVA
jgi:hypothetical protein